jgi:hypothetical protein
MSFIFGLPLPASASGIGGAHEGLARIQMRLACQSLR